MIDVLESEVSHAMDIPLAYVVTHLARAACPMSCAAGDVLFRSGAPVAGVFLVKRGAVRLDSGVPGSEERLLGPGAIVGLPATFSGIYSLTATVTEPAQLGFVPAQRVVELFEKDPKLSLAAMTLVSQELSRTRAAGHEPRVEEPVAAVPNFQI